jgi:hypothetical protein
VGLLTGAALWAQPGSAKVVHVSNNGNVTDLATGLNMVVGVAQSNGQLYASQLSTNFLSQPPAPGSVEQVSNGQSPSTAVANLPIPYGIAFAPDGSLYVSINADAKPGTPPGGQVLKCTLNGQAQPSTAPASSGPSAPAGSPAASPAASTPASPAASAPASAGPSGSGASASPAGMINQRVSMRLPT